jgi:molecular chaperone GrpE
MDDKKTSSAKTTEDKNKKQETKKLETEKQVEEYKHKYLRALADYQNLEKRMQEDKERTVKNANAHLILKLLPFLDSLDKAEVFIKDEGLKIVKDQFHKTLKDEGLKELEVLGKEFDPYTAEVVDIVEGEKDSIVVEVLRKGFEYNGKILRVAQVKVSKKK